jgi:hypothetical protein
MYDGTVAAMAHRDDASEKTAAVITEARRTKAAALAQGRPDIAAKAQAIIDDLTGKERALDDAHERVRDARDVLSRAQAECDEQMQEES